MLLQHGLALTVLMDLLVEQGVLSRDAITKRSQFIWQELGLASETSKTP